MLCFPTSPISWFCTTLRNRKPRNCVFSLKHCMLLCQRTQKTHLNYHLVAAELPFIPKVIDCMHQTIQNYLEREHSILLYVTCLLHVYQVCHSVGRCVKDESCSLSSLEWKLKDCINGISYYLNKCQTLSNTSQMTLFLSGRQRIGPHALCMQHSPTAAELSTSCPPPTAPSWTHWLQDLGSHTAAWVRVLSQKDWRNQGATSWILAMHWYSIWVKKCDFYVSR